MRADKYFAERFGSRTKARDALKKSLVLRNGKPLSPDDEVSDGEAFFFLQPKEEYVSNGGYKLARGLDVFAQSAEGKVFADLGASTGGFTDCLLKRGARHVFCVDVGKSQLDEKLASDERVTVMDDTNARFLRPTDFSLPLDGVVSDLSFISLRLILPAVSALLPESGSAFLLFKPQFECGKGGIGKSGICPRRLHLELLRSFYRFSRELGFAPQDVVNAPLREKKNIEYVLFLKKGGDMITEYEFLSRADSLFEERSK